MVNSKYKGVFALDAFFSLSLSYSGSAEEVALITDIINSYNTGKNGVFICLKQPVVENGITTVSAEGPYGSFGELSEVPIFRELAEAAPGAAFQALISGETSYTRRRLMATLKNRILHIIEHNEDKTDPEEAYTEYFQEKLPYKKFVRLFRLDREEFDEDRYDEFVAVDLFDGLTGSIAEWDYDTFVEVLGDYFKEDVDEEAFEKILKSFIKLAIVSYDDFMPGNGSFGILEARDYDPIAKAYIGEPDCPNPEDVPPSFWKDAELFEADDDFEDED